jgi:hypothetical protein
MRRVVKLPIIDHRFPVGIGHPPPTRGHCIDAWAAEAEHLEWLESLRGEPATAEETRQAKDRARAYLALTGTLDDRMTGRRQCQAFACANNLLVEHSADRPGKRYDGLAPEWSFATKNVSASAPSCSLDVAAQGAKSSAAVAAIMGLSKRRVEQVVAKWKRQCAELAEMGSVVLEED